MTTKLKKKPYLKYIPSQIHELLCKKYLSEEYSNGMYQDTNVWQQACFCPYYVPLKGVLGTDWGVVVNQASPKFGQLVFEHDGCGCSNHERQFGNQLGTSWIMREPKNSQQENKK